ncbi:MAG: hypothetical protein M3186_09200 [Actinomycetota bacterium]|nr:hypothetical protein [Actinomycetota bacterium]
MNLAALELRAVLRRHAEQLANHGERQRAGERVDRVDHCGRSHRVDQLIGDLLDTRRELLDAAPGEGGRDQPAQPSVVRRVAVEHVTDHRRKTSGGSRSRPRMAIAPSF